MKITKSFIKEFENQQKQFGTEVAIKNLYWTIGAGLMKLTGVKRIKTTNGKFNRA